MSELQILNVNDLKHLLDLYRKKFPNTKHGYYTLKNYIFWYELNPNIDHVNVYALDNWKKSGLFIILDRYQIFINTLDLNVNEVSCALRLLDWSRKYKIVALPELLLPVVARTLRELNINIRKVDLKIYERDSNLINKHPEIPVSFVLRPLSIEDANAINDIWYSRQTGSLEFIQSLIRYNISLGIYLKDTDELVAWCTRCQNGLLGTLHVKEQFRGQGLATILIEKFTQEVIDRGEEVRTMIYDENFVSQKLFGNLGFKPVENVYIIYNEI